MSGNRIVIVGGGLTAVRTAQTLRDLGHQGEVRILSAESEPPYDRPPLSKDYLLGKATDDTIRLLSTEAYRDREIALELNRRVVALDTAARTVTVSDGEVIGYDQVVIATGARARTLEVFAECENALDLRTAADARRLATALAQGHPIAVVGGGFIGLEVAAAARTRCCQVSVIEAQQAPLVGAVGPHVAGWLQSQHTARGVAFHCGVTVTGVTPGPTGGARLRLSDGATVEAGTVVVGVGVLREVDWLAEASLAVGDGLRCDASGRSSAPGVFGVGDIVSRHAEEGEFPIAHWTAAGTSARKTAHALLGLEVPTLPDDGYFWSNQYNLRLQCAGRADPDSAFTVAAGDMATDSFVARFHSDGQISGVFAANSPREFLRHRRELANTRTPASIGQGQR